MRFYPLCVAALALALIIVGCTQDNAAQTAATPGDKTPPAVKITQTPAADPAEPAKSDPTSAKTVSFTKDIKPAADKYCMPCHGAAAKGGLNFTKYKSDDEAKADKALFTKAAGEVEGKKMPPPKSPNMPSDDDRAKIVAALKGI